MYDRFDKPTLIRYVYEKTSFYHPTQKRPAYLYELYDVTSALQHPIQSHYHFCRILKIEEPLHELWNIPEADLQYTRFQHPGSYIVQHFENLLRSTHHGSLDLQLPLHQGGNEWDRKSCASSGAPISIQVSRPFHYPQNKTKNQKKKPKKNAMLTYPTQMIEPPSRT